MKRTVAAFIILLLLMACSFIHTQTLNRLSQDISQSIRESRTLYQQGERITAEAVLRNAFDRWQSHQTYLYIFLNHDRMEEINNGFHELPITMNEEYQTAALLNYERLLQQMVQLIRDEQLRVESIF